MTGPEPSRSSEQCAAPAGGSLESPPARPTHLAHGAARAGFRPRRRRPGSAPLRLRQFGSRAREMALDLERPVDVRDTRKLHGL